MLFKIKLHQGLINCLRSVNSEHYLTPDDIFVHYKLQNFIKLPEGTVNIFHEQARDVFCAYNCYAVTNAR